MIFFVVALVIGGGITFGLYYSITRNDKCIIPHEVCKGAYPDQNAFYSGRKTYSILNQHFTFAFTVNFEPTVYNWDHSTTHMGKMHTCIQSFGMQAFDPQNYTSEYFFDKSTCAFHIKEGPDLEYILHTFSDLNVY